MKYADTMVVFEELPNEITLAINITNCPCRCNGCHSKHLWQDIGETLTFAVITALIALNDGITAICFMGGDANPSVINSFAAYVKEKHPTIKVGWYSGKDKISDEIELSNFDYIKVGHYDEKLGGLNKEATNQRLYKIVDGVLINITYMFLRKKY